MRTLISIVPMTFIISTLLLHSALASDDSKTISGFQFQNADIVKVIQKMSELNGENYIIDPGVRGKVSIITPSKITLREAHQAFFTALATNGFTVVRSGAHWQVRSARNAQRDGIEVLVDEMPPDENRMFTLILRLQYISAEQVNKQLRIIPSKDGEIAPYPQENAVIMSDYGPNLRRVWTIIKELDQPMSKEKKRLMKKFEKESRERYRFYQKHRAKSSP